MNRLTNNKINYQTSPGFPLKPIHSVKDPQLAQPQELFQQIFQAQRAKPSPSLQARTVTRKPSPPTKNEVMKRKKGKIKNLRGPGIAPRSSLKLSSLPVGAQPPKAPLDLDHRIFSNRAGQLISHKLMKEREAARKHEEAQVAKIGWESANPALADTRGLQLFSHKIENGVELAFMKGRRPTQEDAHLAKQITISQNGQSLPLHIFGIFDGHGGDKCSNFIANQLEEKLKDKLEDALNKYDNEDVAIFNALKLSFVELSEEFKRCYPYDPSGSTANVALIFKDNLWVANVGDSRAVLSQKDRAEQLSEDAKPDDPKYKKGIEKRGGFVEMGRLNGQLAVARALGDAPVGQGVNCRPKIVKIPLSEAKKEGGHLIIGCDGLWDVASSSQAAKDVDQLVKNRSQGNKAEHLVKKAYQSGSGDNISALIVDLNHPAYGTAQAPRRDTPRAPAPIVPRRGTPRAPAPIVRREPAQALRAEEILQPTKENMNRLIEEARGDYQLSLTNDFELRDKIPQSPKPRSRWPQPNRSPHTRKWGPSATQYPPVQSPSWVEDANQWKRDRVVAVAKKYLGLPYRHHHIPAMGGLDCSNFTSWIYNYGLGIPRFTGGIQDQARVAGRRLSENEPWKPGDLLYINGAGRIVHVVMYLGEDKIIDAMTGSLNNIGVRKFSGWYKRNFSHARRIIE